MSARFKLPLWSKSLVFVVLAVFVSTMALLTKAAFDVRELSGLATQPQYMRRCLNKIAEFQDLPGEYELKAGIDFEVLKITICAIEHAPDRQQIVLFSCIQEQPPSLDSKAILERAYDYGINTQTASAKFVDLKKKGDVTVAGRTMPYMLGQLKDRENRKYEGLVGCIYLKELKKTVLVYALEPSGKELDAQVCFNLLEKIKKF